MQQTEELIEILQVAIENLTDRDIVDLDLCKIGLAFFPRMHHIIASPCFVDGSWHQDVEVREDWHALFGEGFTVCWLPILTLLDNGEIKNVVRSSNQTVDNPIWISQQANSIRARLIQAIPCAAKHLATEASQS